MSETLGPKPSDADEPSDAEIEIEAEVESASEVDTDRFLHVSEEERAEIHSEPEDPAQDGVSPKLMAMGAIALLIILLGSYYLLGTQESPQQIASAPQESTQEPAPKVLEPEPIPVPVREPVIEEPEFTLPPLD